MAGGDRQRGEAKGDGESPHRPAGRAWVGGRVSGGGHLAALHHRCGRSATLRPEPLRGGVGRECRSLPGSAVDSDVAGGGTSRHPRHGGADCPGGVHGGHPLGALGAARRAAGGPGDGRSGGGFPARQLGGAGDDRDAGAPGLSRTCAQLGIRPVGGCHPGSDGGDADGVGMPAPLDCGKPWERHSPPRWRWRLCS